MTKISPGIDSVGFEPMWRAMRSPTDTTLWYPKDLYIDKEDRQWVSEPGSIALLQEDSFTRYMFGREDLSHSFFSSFSIFQIQEHLFAISFTGNAYRFDPVIDGFLPVKAKFDIPFNSVHSVLRMDDTVLLGDENGMHKIWVEEDVLKSEFMSHLDIQNISCMYKYDSTRVILGNFNNDLLTIDARDFRVVAKQTVFRSNGITACKNGNLWISSDEGLVLLRKNFFGAVGGQEHYVESLAVTENSVYYCYKDGVYQIGYKDGEFERKQLIEKANQYFLSITGNDENLYVSNQSRILHFSKGEVIGELDLSDRGLFIFDIFLDKKHRLWVSQDNVEGLLQVDSMGNKTEFNRKRGLDARVLSIFESGNRLFCGGSGLKSYLYTFDDRHDRFINLSLPLDFEPVNDFEINDLTVRNDTLWLATTAGLIRYTKDKIKRIDLGDQTDLSVKAVCKDGQYLWLANTNGIIRLDLKEPDNFIEFNESSGLSSRSGNAKGLRVDSRGNKWVGTAKGLSCSLRDNKMFHETSKPILTTVQVNAERVPLHKFKNNKLPHDGFVKLSFLSLTLPGTFLQYQIRDVKREDHWTNVYDKNFIEIGNLKKGEYHYLIRAKQQGNYFWSKPADIRFAVGNPFYLQWEFIVATFVGIMILLYASHKVNTYRLKQSHDRLNTLVSERTKQLQTANDELQQINQELDMFVYSASHDLKAPLASMIGLLNLYRLEDSPDARDMLIKRMHDSIIKLDSFIKDVIDYSKNSRLEIINEQIDFANIINEVLDSYKYLENFDRVNVDIDIADGHYVTDRNRIRIIFNNLISNGIRYSDIEKDQSFVHIKIRNREDMIWIQVADNGIGISDRHQKRVFDMFYRACEEKVGSGLGLYIVKEAVKALGGIISLESEYGKGTTFTVEIPNQKKD